MSLLAAYNFNEASGNVIDLSGNGRDFALSGGLLRTATGGTDPTGYAGKGITTSDGTADNGPAAFGQTNLRTIMMWAWIPADFTGWIWELHNNAGDTGRWGWLSLNAVMGYRGTNNFTNAHASRAEVTGASWGFWCGVYDGANVKTYYGTDPGVGAALANSVALASPLRTDADVWRVFTTAGASNIVRHVRIFDEALDLATINSLMGTPVDVIDNSVTGDLNLTLPAITASLNGEVVNEGVLALQLPAITGHIDAEVTNEASMALLLPSLTAQLQADASAEGSLALTLPHLRMSLVGIAGVLEGPGDHVDGLSDATWTFAPNNAGVSLKPNNAKVTT